MLLKSSGAGGGSEPPSYGDSIETIISWRCLTTFLHVRGFGADGKALRLKEDVQFVEVKSCLNEVLRPPRCYFRWRRVVDITPRDEYSVEGVEVLTYFQGSLPHGAKIVVHCNTQSLYVLDSPW